MQNAFCEHIVKQKTQGKLLIVKIALVCLYIALLLLPSLAIIIFAPSNLTMTFLVIIAVVVFLIFKFTWKLTSIEYEYQIIEDSIIFTKILGKTKRKTIIEMPIRAFTMLGEHSEKSEKYLSTLMVDRTYLFISSYAAESIYFGLFDAKDEKCIVFFEATDNARLKLKKYAPGAIRAYEREIQKI